MQALTRVFAIAVAEMTATIAAEDAVKAMTIAVIAVDAAEAAIAMKEAVAVLQDAADPEAAEAVVPADAAEVEDLVKNRIY